MNNIATPRRTEPDTLERVLAGGSAAGVLATILLAGILIGFKPLSPSEGPAAAQGGDIVNQLGFGSLGALALISLLLFADPRRLTAFMSLSWAVLLGFLALSILNSPDPASAMRSASFSIIIILSVITFFSLVRGTDNMAAAIKVVAFIVLGLSYFGLVAMPLQAIHQNAGFEAQHAGFWRGIYAHKNITGPVMACLAFAGLYLFRRGDRGSGMIIFLAAMLFVALRARVDTTREPIEPIWFATLISLNALFNAYTPIYDLVLLSVGVALTAEHLAQRYGPNVARTLAVAQVLLVIVYLGPHLSQAIAKSAGAQPVGLLLFALAVWQCGLLLQSQREPSTLSNQLLTSVSG